MKRLFGLTGIAFLLVCTAVFYFANIIIMIALVSSAFLLIICGAGIMIFRSKSNKTAKSLICIGISAVMACLIFALYTCYVYLPVVDNYSDKEISVGGYISEEVQKSGKLYRYIINADEVNGKKENIKLQLTTVSELTISDFDRIKADIYVSETDNNYLKSKGIFLISESYEKPKIYATGEKQQNFYSVAVGIRKAIKKKLSSAMSADCSSLACAVLLGDKLALSYEVREAFTKTGTSFLIVVSGMHLSVLTVFMLFLLKKITSSKRVICASVAAVIIAFSAITGFTPSVVRAGIMTFIAYCAGMFFRQADTVNSLGIAALVLVLPNPYAVGDIGLLLSFSATFGIAVWSKNISGYLAAKLHIKRRALLSVIELLSTSIAASVWIIPVIVFAFGRISLFVVITGTLLEPLVSIFMVASLVSVAIYSVPLISIIAAPFLFVAELLSKLILFIVSFFANIPCCSVRSDKPFFYVWIIVSFALIALGYLRKAGALYVKLSVMLSAVVLMLGWVVFSVLSYNTVSFNVICDGTGTAACIKNGSNVTVISCGGGSNIINTFNDDIARDTEQIDNLIILSKKNKYSKQSPQILSDFNVRNTILYDGKENYINLRINRRTQLYVVNCGEKCYCYVKTENSSVLFTPDSFDIKDIDEQFRSPDYLVADMLPDNLNLLNCESIVYCAKNSRSKWEGKLVNSNFAEVIVPMKSLEEIILE